MRAALRFVAALALAAGGLVVAATGLGLLPELDPVALTGALLLGAGGVVALALVELDR